MTLQLDFLFNSLESEWVLGGKAHFRAIFFPLQVLYHWSVSFWTLIRAQRILNTEIIHLHLHSANAFKSCSIFIVCYLQAFTVPLPLHTYSPEELPFEGSWLLLFVAFKVLCPDACLLPDDMTHPLYAVLYTCIDTCCKRKSHSNSTLWKPFPLCFSLSQPFCSRMHIPEWPLNDL